MNVNHNLFIDDVMLRITLTNVDLVILLDGKKLKSGNPRKVLHRL